MDAPTTTTMTHPHTAIPWDRRPAARRIAWVFVGLAFGLGVFGGVRRALHARPDWSELARESR